jgi:cell division protease FtsH
VERLQALVWFLPLRLFAVGMALYAAAGTASVAVTTDLGAPASLAAALLVGGVLTAALVGARALLPAGSGPSGGEQEELRRGKRVASLRRDAAKMRWRVLRMGAIFAATMFAFWAYFNATTGATPQETFLLPLPAMIATWFLVIVLLPPWLSYMTLVSVIGTRLAFEVWGATILLMLPNFLMLPFFYFFMMIFMFGSVMIPNLMQFKFYKPGDATWEVPKGTMRGQPEARAVVEMEMEKFQNHAAGLTDRPATRGMIFEGPPGTGKTLLAKELGTEYDLPFAFTDAQAFNAPFMGFGPLVVYYFKWRTEQLAKEYGGAIVFIDEAEQLLQQRAGMGTPQPREDVTEVWDMFERDEKGRVRWGDILVDTQKPYSHPIFFGGGGGGMGANAAIFPFLTWLNGADGPPFMKKIARRKANDLLDALFLPPVLAGRILRLPPGKPVKTNVMFIAATNRAWMLDEAIRRPGRFGVTVRFKTPDFKSRVEVADLYFAESVRKGWMREDLHTPERHEELARATQGMSPAEIEAVIKAAPDVRMHHVQNLRRVSELEASGAELSEDDAKYLKRHRDELGQEGWDDTRADWWSLMEARSQVLWGKAAPGMTSEAHKETTAVHEIMGHFLQLKAFMGDAMRPQVLTVMPRGSALGMVAYVPVEERDPMPQSFYEAMLRVSLGSILAERYFFGENQPGVVSDLENATRVASFMVAKCAMVPYGWGEMGDEKKKSLRLMGGSLVAVPETHMQGAKSLIDKVLGDPSTREKVEVFLGMAALDDYRLIKANDALARGLVDELLEVDEFSGQRLEDLWDRLGKDMWSEDGRYVSEEFGWPTRHFAQPSPFYDKARSEAEEAGTW